MGTDTIVDAPSLHAPSSTKNKKRKRNPEMHQTRNGKQWYFGIKAHVGVDAETKLIHSVEATAANAAVCKMLPQLLRGDETEVYGDQAYQGQAEAIRERAFGVMKQRFGSPMCAIADWQRTCTGSKQPAR